MAIGFGEYLQVFFFDKMKIESMMSKHLYRSPSNNCMSAFGLHTVRGLLNTFLDKGQSFIIVPRGRGVRGPPRPGVAPVTLNA
jgi:hypothetical protein